MLFRVSGNSSIRETARQVVRAVQSALPPGWSVRNADRPDSGTDLVITAPTGETAAFGFKVGQRGMTPVSAMAAAAAEGAPRVMYMSDYISAPTRATLEQAGISYADATGWVHIVSDKPMIAITAQGAPKSPKPSSSTTVTRLSGRSAGRVVRALLTISPPAGVRELAEIAQVSPGTVSKTLPVLMADNAVERDQAGRVVGVNRRQLLNRWAIDYQILKSNGRPAYFIAPRGLDAVLAKINTIPQVAATGAQAGAAWLPDDVAPVIPVTLLIVYTVDPDRAASTLGLIPVAPPNANVILLMPQDPAILNNPVVRKGTPIAPLPIVLVDLSTLPGRYPQQATALMDALAKTDPAWRP